MKRILILAFLFIFCAESKKQPSEEITLADAVTFEQEILYEILDIKEKKIDFKGEIPDKPSSIYFSLASFDDKNIVINVNASKISNVYGIALNIEYAPQILKLKEVKFSKIFGNPDFSNAIYLSKLKKEGSIILALTKKGFDSKISILGEQKIAELHFEVLTSGEGEIKFFKPKCAFINNKLERIKDLNYYHAKIIIKE